MRRLWAAGAVIVMCLALGGLPAWGQEASPAPPTPGGDAGSTAKLIHIYQPDCVTGTAGTESYVDGVRQLRGATRHCRYDAADPRFAGPSEIVFNADCYGDSCVTWGTESIPGPDGDWVGTYRGAFIDPDRRWHLEVLEGTGAYEGWTYVNHATLLGEWAFDGLIYYGPPPPVPPLPSPASE